MDPGILLPLTFWLLLYFLPTIVAIVRNNRLGSTLTVNLLLGWTVIGWFVAIALATRPPRKAGPRAEMPAADMPPEHGGGQTPDAVDNLIYVRLFLRDAFDQGLVDARAYNRLIDELKRREPVGAPPTWEALYAPVPAAVAAPEPLAPVPAAVAPPFPAPPPPQPAAYETAPAPPPEPPAPPRPAAWSPWLEQLRKARLVVLSDFAVHGLAYLGVLLTFAGTLGFVLFAYSSVQNEWLRALGPLAVPLFLGITSWMLYRRGSVLVSVSLELLGAALVPVLLSAALNTLVRATGIQFALRTGMALALAAIYAAAVVRRPASPLRYLVAPMAWTAVWTAGLYFRGNYSPAQVALTAVAIALTVAATRLIPKQRFAQPTRFAAFPGIAAVYTLSILFAVTEGGAPLPIFITGVAAIITVELLELDSRRALPLALLQSLLLAISLGAVAQAWNLAAVGMLAALGYLAILEWQERRRPESYALFIPLTGLVIGLGLAVAEAWPALIAGAVISVWIHARRQWPSPSRTMLPPAPSNYALMAAAAAFPLAFASGLWRLLPEARALLILAALVLLVTVVIRRWRPADIFYAWWLPAAAGAIAIATASTERTGSDLEVAAAVALAGVSLALAPRWPIARIWSSLATFALASVLFFDAIHLDAAARPIVWSLAALAVIVIASTRKSLAAGHLALAGYVGSAAALYLAGPGAPAVVTLAAWTGAWLVALVTQELGGSPLVSLLQWASRRVRLSDRVAPVLPPLVFVISAPFLVAEAGDFFAITTHHRSWTGMALGITALAYSAAARFSAGRQPLAAVLATASVPLAGIAIAVAAPDLEPSILTVAGSVAVVGIMGGALRRPFMSWFAWAMAIVLWLLLAVKAGVAVGSLHLMLVGVGGFLMVGGLLYDELRAGLRQPGQGLRIGWLVPPVSLGALAVPVGLAFSFTGASSVYGWWAIGAATLYLVVAILLRTGAVTGVSYALAAFGVATLLPGQPLEHPALLVPFAAVLVAASLALSRVRPSSDPWLRWDIPPLVVAHLVAVLALARTTQVDSVALTFAGFAGLSMVVAAWRRHWAWAAAGAVLLLVAGQAAGHGWFALALAATGAGAALAASRTVGFNRLGLQLLSLVSIAAAWLEAMAWANWSTDQEVAFTALASGGLAVAIAGGARVRRISASGAAPWSALATVGIVSSAGLATALLIGRPFAFAVAAGLALYGLACVIAVTPFQWPWLAWPTVGALGWAWGETVIGTGWTVDQGVAFTALAAGVIGIATGVLTRTSRLPREWILPWGSLATIGLGGAIFTGATVGTQRDPYALAVAAGLALYAVGVGLAARPLSPSPVGGRLGWGPWLREASAVLAVASGATVLYDRQPAVEQSVAVAVAAGLAALVVSLAVWRNRPRSAWLRPLALYASLAGAGGLGLALVAWPNRGPLVITLLVIGAEAAAVGLTLRRPTPLYASPVLACAAWLLFAADALHGNPNWLTVPIGLALLIMVELARWDRRRGTGLPDDPFLNNGLLILEYAGMAFLTGAALVQTVFDSVWYGLLGVSLGVALVGWAAFTRVRRRTQVGAGVVLLSLFLMLTVPVVRLVPQLHDITLWGAVAAVGVLLLLVATTIEQSRTRVMAGIRRLDQLMVGWE